MGRYTPDSTVIYRTVAKKRPLMKEHPPLTIDSCIESEFARMNAHPRVRCTPLTTLISALASGCILAKVFCIE